MRQLAIVQTTPRRERDQATALQHATCVIALAVTMATRTPAVTMATRTLAVTMATRTPAI